MDKVIRDGKVAVLYSPGYGAGWYTWGHLTWMIFEPRLVAAVERGASEAEIGAIALEIAREKGDEEPYTGGARGLTIEWLPEGTAFEVTEYDGYEGIRVIDNIPYITA